MIASHRLMTEAIQRARSLLAEPKAGEGLIAALFAAGFCAMAATLLAGAVIFGQMS